MHPITPINDFTAFLEAWDTRNNDRTKEEQDFCLTFKRQIIPTMVQIVKVRDGAKNYQDALKRIVVEIPYDDQIQMVWEELYGSK